jgi:hypothetical protein
VTATGLLADLARQGFNLTPDGGGIRVTPASRLTGELRQAIRAHKAALLDLLSCRKDPAPPFAWDQAEAELLLAQLREALARVEGAVAACKAPAVRAVTLRTWLEVAEGVVSDREREAGRGWDALELLRGAARQALRAAGGEQPQLVAYTPAEQSRLCRWLESFCGWPPGSAALWEPPGRPDPS